MPWQAVAIIVFVAILYVAADAIFDISKKIGNLKTLLLPVRVSTLSWVRLGALAIALGAGAAAVLTYTGSIRRAERAETQVETSKGVIRQTEAQSNLNADALQNLDEYDTRRAQTRRAVSKAREEISDAPDFDAAYAAYDGLVRELRDNADSAVARAIEDYNSSLDRSNP